MSFLKNIFGGSSNEDKENREEAKFYTLDSQSQLDEIDAISKDKPVVLFKHSTRCIISRTVLRQFDNGFNFSDSELDWYLLDLLNHRDISNEITNRYGIMHQSPQILVVKEGKAVYNASHEGIAVEDLKQFV
ncbi:hypothetical protein SY27_02485 [Flavobacterium sp. 316]|uniref:Bacillithiol system redox-active protein YtxJ n=1 Tax=Flavobacterium sediminilitoris TaxID=2024526 RepID=A0ABY4HK18_9FLAO|nr:MULTISPECIES: bacillithiol system redox-active protein YtxJ [Flavobacterium]KIX22709.1 hypothetical protein SY27_02485 [Flavobacterium sp. 316]UOX33055.1 bacillithiol system redox-active protein YtxJ [Flavobacterium sediminilitoris]